MIGRIVEIAENGRHLTLLRGFLVVQGKTLDKWEELGRIPLDDILAVICNAYGVTYTNNILVALSERGIPFVLCADNHKPVGMIWPIEGHHFQAKRFEAQLEASLPRKKNLWADLVRAKIRSQRFTLNRIGIESAALLRLEKQVKSGDPANCEAQAARIYWKLLLGEDFLRDRNALGANALLNYGYTIIRSAVARAVIAAGLHPSLGLHHSNDGNAMRLVDDLMEPYRPLVDWVVWQIVQENEGAEVDAKHKRRLVQTLFMDTEMTESVCPVMVSMQLLATSLASVFLGERKKLELPVDFHF